VECGGQLWGAALCYDFRQAVSNYFLRELMLLFESLLCGTLLLLGVLPLRCRWYVKVGIGLLVLVGSFKFHFTRLIGGPMFFAPQLPSWLLLFLSWLFSVWFMLFFLLLAASAVYLVILLSELVRRRQLPEWLRTVANRVNLGLLLGAVVLATLGVIWGRSDPVVREVPITLEGLPHAAEGLTVAVLADIHADKLTRADRVAAMVAIANAARPGLIVLLGDLVDGTVAEHGRDLLPLRELSAPHGVFAVPGNHEYYSGYQEWMEYLSAAGITMLTNAHVELPGLGVVLAGVTDPAARRFGLEGPDLSRALAGRPPEAPVILLSHRPALAWDSAQHGVDLQLSGHTHGGMLTGLDYLVARFNGGHVAGWYLVGGMQLYVNRGTGIWNGFPVRIGVPPEITLLRLQRG